MLSGNETERLRLPPRRLSTAGPPTPTSLLLGGTEVSAGSDSQGPSPSRTGFPHRLAPNSPRGAGWGHPWSITRWVGQKRARPNHRH